MALRVTTIKLPPDVFERVRVLAHLKSIAQRKNVTAAELMREAIAKFIAAETQP